MHSKKKELMRKFLRSSFFSAPQNYTYPSRSYPYVQRGVPPNYYNETNDRLGILDDLFIPRQEGGDQHVDVYRDNSDDEIFV
jgi:hypothetical protein